MSAAAPPVADAPPEDDLAGLLDNLARIEREFESWDEQPRSEVEAYRRAIDALHAEALRRLIRTFKGDPAALAAMKQAVADDVVYAVLRHHELVKPSLNERVEAALENVRPMLASHGGGVELINVAPPAIKVRFTGSCDGCAASALTFHAGVKKAIDAACPEITEIVQVKGHAGVSGDRNRFSSPFALEGKGEWLPAGLLADVPENELRAVTLGGESVMLTRRGNTVTSFRNACAHLGLALNEGAVADGVITCPHHGFRYEAASGRCLTAPDVALHMNAVRVVGGRIEVRLSR